MKLAELLLTESKKKKLDPVNEALTRHVEQGVPLCDSIFRYQSSAYFDTFRKARQLREAGELNQLDWESEEMLATDIGESVVLENGDTVWLDVPYLDQEQLTEGPVGKALGVLAVAAALYGGGKFTSAENTPLGDAMAKAAAGGDRTAEYHLARLDDYADRNMSVIMTKLSARYLRGENVEIPMPETNEAKHQGKDVDLNKPKRGGDKKFYVYVRDPKSKNIRKVSFGAKSGGGNLSVKLKDPKRRKAFADRHNCAQKNDKTKPGYWACRLPRYAKSLGLSGGGTWW
jgi:hypothetical protein